MANGVKGARTVSVPAVAIILAVCLGIGIFQVAVLLAAQKRYDILAAEHVLLQQQYQEIESERDRLRDDYSALQIQHTALLANYSDLEINFSTLQADFSALETRQAELQTEYTALSDDYSALSEDYSSLQVKHTELEAQFNSLKSSYSGLSTLYTQLQSRYDSLNAEYQSLFAYGLTPPYTSIKNGTVAWRFYDLSGAVLDWTMPIDTYRYYVNMPKSTAVVWLHSDRLNKDFKMLDVRPYILPSFFSQVIPTLTFGRADKDFVRAVDQIKNQIVVYGSGMGDFYRWPAETLTEGRGMCGDTTILMASMLIAGNNQAHYGMKIFVWYVNLESISSPDGIADHALIGIQFTDGTYWILETTTNYFYLHTSVWGWSFDVTQAG